MNSTYPFSGLSHTNYLYPGYEDTLGIIRIPGSPGKIGNALIMIPGDNQEFRYSYYGFPGIISGIIRFRDNPGNWELLL